MSEPPETIENTEIANLQAEIAALDTSVAVAADMRDKEHADFTASSAANQAAVELLPHEQVLQPSVKPTPLTGTKSAGPGLSLRSE